MPEEAKFRLGRYWLDRVNGSPNWYRFWYDPVARKSRPRTLGTPDEEEAKILLAAIVLQEGDHAADPRQGGDPADIRLITVFEYYWTNYSDKRPRKGDAHYACETLLNYLDSALERAARVSDLSRARQRAFMKHASDELGHAVGTISRNLSIVNAALNFAAEEQIIVDVNGEEQDIKLLKFAPKIYYAKTYISEITGAPMPAPRNEVPQLEDLARFVEDIRTERLFRYIVLALNTWARPGAVVQLGPAAVDRDRWLLDINPSGRRQTKKRRPVIAVSKNLKGWIEYWASVDPDDATHWITYKGEPVADIKTAWRAHRDATDEDGKRLYPDTITRYAMRHLMATVARNSRRPRVPKEQRAIMLGHTDPDRRVTDGYGIYEPGFLREAVQATDAFLTKLNDAIRARAKAEGRIPKRLLVAPKLHQKASGASSPMDGKSLKIVG